MHVTTYWEKTVTPTSRWRSSNASGGNGSAEVVDFPVTTTPGTSPCWSKSWLLNEIMDEWMIENFYVIDYNLFNELIEWYAWNSLLFLCFCVLSSLFVYWDVSILFIVGKGGWGNQNISLIYSISYLDFGQYVSCLLCLS